MTGGAQVCARDDRVDGLPVEGRTIKHGARAVTATPSAG
jgi:hypothetical protein